MRLPAGEPDVGKFLVLDELPEKCGEIGEMVRSANCRLSEAEVEILGTTHAQIGGYLMGIWGLSELSVEAVTSVALHQTRDQAFSTLTAVHPANRIVLYHAAG